MTALVAHTMFHVVRGPANHSVILAVKQATPYARPDIHRGATAGCGMVGVAALAS
jgi:hypothetical protein